MKLSQIHNTIKQKGGIYSGKAILGTNIQRRRSCNIRHQEGTFSDEHPGGICHQHAFERIVAIKK